MSTSASALLAQLESRGRSQAWVEGYLRAQTSNPVLEHAEAARAALADLHLKTLL